MRRNRILAVTAIFTVLQLPAASAEGLAHDRSRPAGGSDVRASDLDFSVRLPELTFGSESREERRARAASRLIGSPDPSARSLTEGLEFNFRGSGVQRDPDYTDRLRSTIRGEAVDRPAFSFSLKKRF